MSAIIPRWLTTAQPASSFGIRYALYSRCTHRFYSRLGVKENDIVLLRRRGNNKTLQFLTKPLCPKGKIGTHHGGIDHADLIGKNISDVAYTTKGVGYRIYQPTLAEYVTLSRRMVTPVYPADANLIVSLLDIHPPATTEDDLVKQPFEIFEAGTGHGSLTLHLARAIQGLNPNPPPVPRIKLSNWPSIVNPQPENPDLTNSDQTGLPNGEILTGKPTILSEEISIHDQASRAFNKPTNGPKEKSIEEAGFEAYLATRRAVIHTLDISPTISKQAQDTIRSFRHGLYLHNIDFHIGTIGEYLSSRLATASEPFLEHTILDLPNPQDHLEIVGEALKPNGALVVFCPSITQIAECAKVIGEESLPFALESVLELGAGAGVGGREWDVRVVKPRAMLKAEADAAAATAAAEASRAKGETDAAAASVADQADNGPRASSVTKDSGWSMVCRPKVGSMVTGGGFIGLWRRTSPKVVLKIKPSTA